MSNFKKLFFILGVFDLKLKFSFLFVIGTFMLLFDFLSIGSVFPLVLSILDKDINLKFFNLNFENFETTFLLILCLAFFILKSLLSIIFVFISQNYLWDFYIRASNFLLNRELKKKFEDFYLTNSSLTLRNIREITVGFKNYLDATVTLISEYLSFIAIFLILIYLNFKVTLITVVIFVFFITIYLKFFKKKSKIWGIKQAESSAELNKIILNFRNSFSDIKLYEKENFFYNLFYSTNKVYSKNLKNIAVTHGATRYFFEIIIISFLFYLFFYNLSKTNFIDIIPFFSVYIVCIFRLVPSLNRILNGNLTRKNLSYCVDIIYSFFKDTNLRKKNIDLDALAKFDFNESISFKNIMFYYNDSNNKVIDDLSFTIEKNSFVGISGPSGSGKSTIFKILSGLLNVKKGEFKFDDKTDFKDIDKRSYYKKIAYVPQKVFLLNGTLKENVLFGSDFNEERFNKVLYISCIDDVINSLPDRENSNVLDHSANFSGGQEQRIAIARALYKNPEILLLDEATNGLDHSTELNIINRILDNYSNLTIIFATHRTKSFEKCDKVIKI